MCVCDRGCRMLIRIRTIPPKTGPDQFSNFRSRMINKKATDGFTWWKWVTCIKSTERIEMLFVYTRKLLLKENFPVWKWLNAVCMSRENCERKTVRLMRQFYRRPYFVPPMVEVVDRSWMFVSADYTSQTYKPVSCHFVLYVKSNLIVSAASLRC